MQKKLLILSFIEGAVVMAAELCGAKLLAPIFGSSLYVWASVMGITLAALAAGYFFGGMLSDRSSQKNKALFIVLSLASIFVMLMPVLSYYLLPRISYLPYLPAVVFGTIIMLFFPVFFLGATSPLFISIQASNNNAGSVSGTVYAVSTAGGILSTFLCGFYLIPSIGLTLCLVGFGVLLFVMNLAVLKLFRPLQLLLFVSGLYLNLQFSLRNENVLTASESILGRLEVLDINVGDAPVRLLRINNVIQTEMGLQTRKSVSEYVHLLDTLVPISKNRGSALVLGLGGGLVANMLVEKNYETDAVEIDQRIIDVAGSFFNLQRSVHSFCGDARYFLNTCKKRYDIIVIDIFKAEEQPSHIVTIESLEALKKNLGGGGRIFINWHGYIAGNRGLGTRILYNTLLKAGYSVRICSRSKDENYRNLLFVAATRELPNLVFELDEMNYPTDLANTDDLPILEKFNAEANKSWRVNYLRYYQNQQKLTTR